MRSPTNPLAGFDPSSLMQQSQQTLQSPMAQTTPQGSGAINPSQHPVIAALIKALAGGAQAYGWSAMQPDERLQRQAMEQKKAETLAGLASTSAYREGELANKDILAGIAGQRQDTNQQKADTYKQATDFQAQYKTQQLAEKTSHDQAMQALGQNRIDVASARESDYLQSIKNRYDIATKQLGLEGGKLAVSEDLANISNYRSQLYAMALNSTDASKRAEAMTAISKLESDHYVQNWLGIGGIPEAAGTSQQVPGVGALPGTAPQTQPVMPTPPPMLGGKVGAKQQQRNGGVAPAGSDPFAQFGGKAH